MVEKSISRALFKCQEFLLFFILHHNINVVERYLDAFSYECVVDALVDVALNEQGG